VTAFSPDFSSIAEADRSLVRVWPISAAGETYDLLPASSQISEDLSSLSEPSGGSWTIKTRRGETTGAPPGVGGIRWAGKYVVSTSGPLWIYDSDSKKVWRPQGHSFNAQQMVVSGDRFALSWENCSVWRFLQETPLLRRECSAIALRPESGGAVIERQSVDLYSEAGGRWTKTGEIKLNSAIQRVVYSPRGDQMAVLDSSRSLRLYDAAGRFQRTLWYPQGAPLHAAWSPDGKLLLTADNTGRMLIWDLRSGRTMPSGDPARDLRLHQSPLEEAMFSTDQDRLAVFTEGWVTLYTLDGSGLRFHAARPLDGTYITARFLDSGNELEIAVELAPNQQAIQKMKWTGSANPPRLTYDQWAVKCGLKVNIAGQFEPIYPPSRVGASASGSTGGGF
jgi:WD40 repeat protein